MTALLILCLAFFAMLQIYHWCVNKLFTEYSAFYATRGMALGYQYNFAQRAARVAAIGISGRAIGYSRTDERSAAKNYMQKGDLSGVTYEYWDWNRQNQPYLNFYGHYESLENGGENVVGSVGLDNARLLSGFFEKIFGISQNPECRSAVSNYNYSKLFLEE